ncbi:SGNH/GDSL hydrolase family protein [Actinoplanes sp. NPDC049118]|uniref:SGNH/GDSL hydrolase family protein n=1 Tax=Actinoplanes sp. NPDC049118 TaxID=3155769 RepID=UPI0033F96096
MTESTYADAGLFPREATDPHCLTDDQADELLRASHWQRFVVVGDSLAKGLGEPTDGYRSLPWGARTAAALRRAQPDLVHLNLGVENLRAAEVRETQLDAALALKPDLAAVVCGGNDILPRNFDPEAVSADLDGIMGPLREAGADIVTFTLQDLSAAYPALAEGPLLPRIRQLNDLVREVAARHDAIVVEMWSHPARADRDIYSSDLKHASMRGHAIVAAATIRALGARLAARAAA